MLRETLLTQAQGAKAQSRRMGRRRSAVFDAEAAEARRRREREDRRKGECGHGGRVRSSKTPPLPSLSLPLCASAPAPLRQDRCPPLHAGPEPDGGAVAATILPWVVVPLRGWRGRCGPVGRGAGGRSWRWARPGWRWWRASCRSRCATMESTASCCCSIPMRVCHVLGATSAAWDVVSGGIDCAGRPRISSPHRRTRRRDRADGAAQFVLDDPGHARAALAEPGGGLSGVLAPRRSRRCSSTWGGCCRLGGCCRWRWPAW